jgi:hypothetical protein
MEGEGAMERRIRIVGLCLLAVFALGAVVASAAQAAPEFGQCVKTEKKGKVYKGQYTNKECTHKTTAEKEAKGGKENKYKWEGGPGHKATFLAKGKIVKLTIGAVEIECKKSSGTGSVIDSATVTATFTFTGCLEPNHLNEKCESSKAELGEIETDALVGKLEETVGKEVRINFAHKAAGNEPAPSEPWVVFNCPGEKFTLTGNLAGKWSGEFGKMSKRGGTEFSSIVGEQGLEAEFINPVTLVEEEEPAQLEFGSAFKSELLLELRRSEEVTEE